MDAAFEVLRAALEARGDDVFLRRERDTVSSAKALAGITRARGEVAGLPVPLEAGDVVALRGRHLALQVAAPLTAWSLGLCTQMLSEREPSSSVEGLLSQSGARMLFGWHEGVFEGLPVPGPRRVRLPTGTLLSTSGSRGTPKLVVHTLAQHVASARAAIEALGIGPGDRLLLSLPTYHVGGLSILFRALLSGAELCVPPPDVSTAEALGLFEPTHVSLVATQLGRLLRDPVQAARLAHCRAVLVGGGPVPAALRAAALAQGVPLIVSYGATETAAFVALSDEPDLVRREACAGRPLPGRTVRVDDAGALRVGGPSLCAGYLVADAVEDLRGPDGLWDTGDLGRLEDGVLYVTGRRDRMFVSGGENVQPEDIEEALLALEGVAQAVVVPVPHGEFGLRPVAFLRGVGLDRARIDAALRAVLPGFKTPDAYYRLPTAPDGRLKPDLRALQAQAADPLAAARLERL